MRVRVRQTCITGHDNVGIGVLHAPGREGEESVYVRLCVSHSSSEHEKMK